MSVNLSSMSIQQLNDSHGILEPQRHLKTDFLEEKCHLTEKNIKVLGRTHVCSTCKLDKEPYLTMNNAT
jgi:hypothetical protein